MIIPDDKVNRFSLALQKMLLKMQEVDNSCLEVSKDLSKREFTLIIFIGKTGNTIMRDVADFLQVPVSTATGIVDKLVERKYLKRIHSDEDRRIVQVCLDKQGKAAFDLLQRQMFKMCHRILTDLTTNDQDCFIDILDKISSNLDQHVPALQEAK